MPASRLSFEEVNELARLLTPSNVLEVLALSGGANNSIFRVEAENGRYALKLYLDTPEDDRNRFFNEVSALRFFADSGIGNVPRLAAADEDAKAALLEWIDGDTPADATEETVRAMAGFVETLKTLSARPESGSIGNAVEACLSGAEIDRQLNFRKSALMDREVPDAPADFIESQLAPVMDRRLADAKAAMGAGWDTGLRREHQVLSPSDFGLHNAIRKPTGGIVFVDFEYFGWDDPVKLLADTWWHPGMNLPETLSNDFLAAGMPLFDSDPHFNTRLRVFLPLYGLRWIFIVLADFLPGRWRRRQAAGETNSWEAVKKRQLDKAKILLHRIEHHDFSWAPTA